MYFSTWDRDNDRWSGGNVAVYLGGWWYNDDTVIDSNLNAPYGDAEYMWDYNHNLDASRMMIKTK